MAEDAGSSDILAAWLREQLEGLHQTARNHEQLLGSTVLLTMTQQHRLAWVAVETIYVDYIQMCIDAKLTAMMEALANNCEAADHMSAALRAQEQIQDAFRTVVPSLAEATPDNAWQTTINFRDECNRIMFASGIWSRKPANG